MSDSTTTNETNAVETVSTRATFADAVKFARFTLHAENPIYRTGTDEARRPSAASCGDHMAVRTIVTEMVEKAGGTVDKAAIVKASGMKSRAAIIRAAKFDASESITPMRGTDVDKAIRAIGVNVGWRTGHYVAGIYAAWIREIA